MKIYTKTGDKGITSLYGGTRVPKNDIRIQAYGDVDELNSYLGFIRSYTKQKELDDQLQVIQNSLFDLGAELATPSKKMILANGKPRLACLISEKQISFLEEWIDAMESELPALTQFILPTGCQATSVSHIARTICRRSERSVISLNEQEELRPLCYIYLNRLSDYLFVLARYFGHLAGHKETPWTPNE
ncbi:cob(I)yrinic acid a,c-diamide adenosyltransferase [Apibacter sp. HY039]|uniref:cob(I)yrinic acid a,c-diamide adenosyltransferase n=1 Tax=Apibacter sp. HY039 TaxID=2501476 RepID=UPI000FEB70AE|nr:cob(I)yrinic acid a,c-diamide adenosyltransferase [Apibacter sp. HY039]